MTLKPYHEHELLHDYSEWRESKLRAYQYSAEWYCPACDCEIAGPPYAIGEYVVTRAFRVYGGWTWRVYPLFAWKSPRRPRNAGHVFESKRKREALKHARYLERNRLQIQAIIRGEYSTPDERLRAIAENHREVQRVQREERDV